MTHAEKKILADLLDRAADEYASHGCNDLELPNTQEVVDLLNAIEQDNVGPGREPEEVFVYDPTETQLIYTDFSVMRYFAAKFRKEAGG
jgi:hypothetical protein